MRSLPLRFARGSASALPLAVALSLSSACTVPVDSSTPGGLIHATVQYLGPRPQCTYAMQGTQPVPTGFALAIPAGVGFMMIWSPVLMLGMT